MSDRGDITKKDRFLNKVASSLIALGNTFIPEMMTSESPPFHYDLEMHLRDVRQRLLVVVAPRAHAKSSLAAALLVIWHLFLEDRWRYMQGLGKGPEQTAKHVILISKTRKEAIKRLGTIKAILGDEDGAYSSGMRRMFGSWGITTSRKWTEGEIILKDGTVITALGMGQQTRGLKQVHLRVTLVVADDAEDENNTRTDTAMTKNRQWLLQAVMPALDVATGRVVVIGTPINTQCLVVKLQEAAGWRVLWYKNDGVKNQSLWYDSATRDWSRKKGVLWPNHITRRRLAEEKATARSMGMLSSYYREWEALVIGDEDQIFRLDYLQTWNGHIERDAANQAILVVTKRAGVTHDPPLRLPVLVTTGVDPAASTAVAADKTAVVNVATDFDDNVYILFEGVLRRLAPDAVVSAIAANDKLVNPFRGLLEVSAAFEYIWTYLARDHQIFYMKDKPTIKKKGEGSRLESLQPIFAMLKVFLPEGFDEGRDQLLAYPRGKDDWIDALEKACRIRSTPFHSEIEEDNIQVYAEKPTHDPMTA